MKKVWKKPFCITLESADLSAHIKAAAGSICSIFVIR